MRKRNSFCSMTKEQFLNPATGPFRRLDNTAWYIKKRDNKNCFFLNMQSKFQQMPDACFKATTEGSPDIDVEVINQDFAKFMEANNDQT